MEMFAIVECPRRVTEIRGWGFQVLVQLGSMSGVGPC